MFRDNIPTVRLGSWPLTAALFDGEVAAGPLPTLFGPDAETALAAITADPAKAHYDIQRLSKVFVAAEYILLAEGPAILKKPRYVLNPYKFLYINTIYFIYKYHNSHVIFSVIL